MKRLILAAFLLVSSSTLFADEVETTRQALGENCFIDVSYLPDGGCGSAGPQIRVDWEVSNLDSGAYDVVISYESFNGFSEDIISFNGFFGGFESGTTYEPVFRNDTYVVTMEVFDPFGFRSCTSRTRTVNTY